MVWSIRGRRGNRRLGTKVAMGELEGPLMKQMFSALIDFLRRKERMRRETRRLVRRAVCCCWSLEE
jgi:hypothetical protein